MGFLDQADSLLGVSNAIQAVKNAAGLGILAPALNTKQDPNVAWGASAVQSKFFRAIKISPERWDQLFPYRLLVIDSKNNQVVHGAGGTLAPPKIRVTKGTGFTTIEFEPMAGAWILNLPITPQQLNITDQFAINTTATLRGVLEEHSGVRFKLISASGTMGVWPYRESLTKPPESPGLIQSVFGGAIEAVGNIAGQVNRVINAATTDHPANKPTSIRPEASQHGETGTGYFFALALAQFLEQYAEAKKDPKNASWRLVFDIPKQNQSLVVTPMQFTWQQNANKAMEIMYSFQLKAWRRIELGTAVDTIKANNQPISPGILQRVLSTVSEARKTMGSANNLISAVGGDVGVLKGLARF